MIITRGEIIIDTVYFEKKIIICRTCLENILFILNYGIICFSLLNNVQEVIMLFVFRTRKVN